jgi:hypothetical protein
MIGNRIQSFHRPGHRQHRRLQYVDLVNLGFGTLRHREARTFDNFHFEPRAFCGRQLLAVIQSDDRMIVRQYHRSSHDRASERPPAHLVDTSDHRLSS